MHFYCNCGNRISDITDYLSYKGYVIADEDQFDFLEEIDRAIEESGPSPKEKEDALMKVRRLWGDLTRSVYQCPECGTVYFDNHKNELKGFTRGDENTDKTLLRSAKGDAWPGFIYGDWVDEKPEWREKGYIDATSLSEMKIYEDWDSLKSDYYVLFHELKEKNLLRSGILKKNGEWIHSWSGRD
ncbi:hypothetical protein ACFVQB_27650 [Paenibacillus sp. NPDC057886]|uniref:hypothetical protein n=1 Tax=Paenibacillus sp. NPDC057886 TaxID=3346270 RepID=UPI0036AD5365